MELRELNQIVESFELALAKKGEFERYFDEINTYLKQKGQILKQWEEFAIFGEYRKAVQQAESILGNIKKFIQGAQAQNVLETDEVNFQLSPENIEVFYKLNVYFDLAIWNLRKIYIATHQTQSILVEAEDFPSSLPHNLNAICQTMSGSWDLNNVNARLRSEKHAVLKEDGINDGFYNDYHDIYFKGQNLLLRGRAVSSKPQINLSTFVTSFLKANHLPESARPNLNGLISTLAYQSGISYILADEAFKHIRLSSTNKGVFEVGKNWSLHTYFDFDDKGKITISFLSETKPKRPLKLARLNSGEAFEKPGPDIYLQGELTIQMSLDSHSNPIFTPKSFKKNLFCYLDEKQSKKYHWIIDKNWIKPKNSLHKVVLGTGVFLSLALLLGVVTALVTGNIPSELLNFIARFLEIGAELFGINTLTDIFAVGGPLNTGITIGLIIAVPILLTLISAKRLLTAYANEIEMLPQNRFQLSERKELKPRNLITEPSDTHNVRPKPLFPQVPSEEPTTGNQLTNTAGQNSTSLTDSQKSL